MTDIRAVPRAARFALAGLASLLLLVSACSSPDAEPPAAAAPAPSGAPTSATTAGLAPTPLRVGAGMGDAPFDTARTVDVPAGWTASVWARLPGARLEAWAPDGSLLVSLPGDGQVVRLVPGADGAAPARTTLLSGLTQPHGLAFDGSTLYVAESNQVSAYAYAAGAATGKRVVVPGLPDAKSPDLRGTYAHALKSVVVGPDGSLYVSVGSTANISPQDRDADPQRAAILRVPPGGGAPQVYARGVRNGTGLALGPDGRVWTAVNNRDNIQYPFHQPYGGDGDAYGQVIPGYVNDHPPEELAALTPGRDLGWPFCNPEPDTRPGVPGTPLKQADLGFTRDAETNGDGAQLDCSTLPPIEQTFGAHSAPLGLAFATLPGKGEGAVVGVHGSWNRTAPRAPEVSFFPWSNGRMGDQQTLVGGFQATDGSRWGRPVAAVPGPDGALYVSDDQAGAIYRVAPPGR
ncbi:sorbosone dehydrogenase family protein [Actinomycetospora sp. TBRC 11914]|uniref:PQQ-dependent sugar dehydrogenase n=1 Tax=Actinomycetospora sp. TBRC 11914 TaxID=2729387 RepID=UPI00145F10F8|nr:PQQ-dependent sugar dehydrogenase [Actinomycetospora sp. TBRC 11914]NMO94127.1 gluconolaconase [Actinomycetospora sp. TBRC 11914]